MTEFDKLAVAHKPDTTLRSHRRVAASLIGMALLLPLIARGNGVATKETVLSVVMYSALDRPIYGIIFNGTDLGVANKFGGTGIITDVRIPFGIQELTWILDGPEGAPRNGKRVTMKNKIVISPEQIPVGTRYIGLNVYPDDTAEVTFSEFMPERSSRGKEIRARRLKS
jgi:hypothetical protein